MKSLKLLFWVTVSSLLLFTLGCSTPAFDLLPGSTGRALASRQIKRAIPSYESQAQEEEKKAASSVFSQQHRSTASSAYRFAPRAARYSGQLQKSISYSEKALETAEKAKDHSGQVEAIDTLIGTYQSIGNFEKARELIEKGLVIVKGIVPNSNPRLRLESALYSDLGADLMHRREYEKAIDIFSQSLYLAENLVSGVARLSALDPYTGLVWSTFLNRLNSLGKAYHEAGISEEALEQYERAINSPGRRGESRKT